MKQRESGFTIIETSLALAVTGLVIALTLLGIGAGLNSQRYNDAVTQTVDFFRGQYTQASSTVNTRPVTENCGSGGITTNGPSAIRGATECMLVGKMLRSANGKDITVNQVIARSDPSLLANVSTMSDNAILSASQLQVGNLLETYQPDWATTLLVPSTSNAATFSIMIVRTPVSGTIHTYSSSSSTVLPGAILSSQDDMTMCIDQKGFFSGITAPMGVRVVKDAVNTTGVRILPAGECV